MYNFTSDDCANHIETLGYDLVRFLPDGQLHRYGSYPSLRLANLQLQDFSDDPNVKVIDRTTPR
jgi:hypothetical protein